MTRVRVALMVEGQEGVTWPEWLDLARSAEDAQLEALFRSDHLSSVYREREGSLEAWTTLAGLAAVTSRIRLGTLVTPVTFRHPSVLARAVATVDHISGGRVELGLGAGWFEREHVEASIPFPQPAAARVDLLGEQLEVIVQTWTESTVALPRPVQQPHPPIVLGGTARPRSAALAARWASEYNSLGAPVEELAVRRARLDAACEAIGRDPATLGLSLMTTAVVGAGQREIEARMAVAREIAGPEWDAQVENWIVGTPESAVERIEALAAAGVGRVFLKVLDHRDLEAVALVGEIAAEVRG